MTGRGGPRLAAACLVAALSLAITSTLARAVSPAAEALFQEGRRLLAAGETDAACARFSESYAAEASSGTLLNLALCHEKQGKIATAWAEYRGAARLARNQGREDRASVADGKVGALEARLPRLTSVAARPVPGLQIATEGGALGEGGLGVAVPVDPGVHQVTVSAPGYSTWTTRVDLKEGEQRTLAIPELASKPVPAATRPLPPALQLALPEAPAARSRRLSAPVVALGSVGIAGLVGGAVLALVSRSRNEEAKTLCRGDTCGDQAEKDRHDGLVASARRDRTIGIVSAGLGGAALLTSIYLWRRAGAAGTPPRTPGARVSARLVAPPRGMGGAVHLEW